MTRPALSILIALVVLVPATPAAGVGGVDGPRANAASKCKSVQTRDGGRSVVIRTFGSGLKCRRARRVAARASGTSYQALGFTCEPSGEPTRYGLLYGCGAIVDGRRHGIGFFYEQG